MFAANSSPQYSSPQNRHEQWLQSNATPLLPLRAEGFGVSISDWNDTYVREEITSTAAASTSTTRTSFSEKEYDRKNDETFCWDGADLPTQRSDPSQSLWGSKSGDHNTPITATAVPPRADMYHMPFFQTPDVSTVTTQNLDPPSDFMRFGFNLMDQKTKDPSGHTPTYEPIPAHGSEFGQTAKPLDPTAEAFTYSSGETSTSTHFETLSPTKLGYAPHASFGSKSFNSPNHFAGQSGSLFPERRRSDMDEVNRLARDIATQHVVDKQASMDKAQAEMMHRARLQTATSILHPSDLPLFNELAANYIGRFESTHAQMSVTGAMSRDVQKFSFHDTNRGRKMYTQPRPRQNHQAPATERQKGHARERTQFPSQVVRNSKRTSSNNQSRSQVYHQQDNKAMIRKAHTSEDTSFPWTTSLNARISETQSQSYDGVAPRKAPMQIPPELPCHNAVTMTHESTHHGELAKTNGLPLTRKASRSKIPTGSGKDMQQAVGKDRSRKSRSSRVKGSDAGGGPNNSTQSGQEHTPKHDRSHAESPATRLAYKEFFREFRALEKNSNGDPAAAKQFAVTCIKEERLPKKVHWRLYLELADISKRENKWGEARSYYQNSCEIQPFAPQCWLEWAKMEEERGFIKRSDRILMLGLGHCEYSEALLTRAIKLEERKWTTEDSNLTLRTTAERMLCRFVEIAMKRSSHSATAQFIVSSQSSTSPPVPDDVRVAQIPSTYSNGLHRARNLLARLKNASIDKVWRTVQEGALLEARSGEIETARTVFKYLMEQVPWYGPIYFEASRLEERAGCHLNAMKIIQRGLSEIPRYGPLWFGLFRGSERLDIDEWVQLLRRKVSPSTEQHSMPQILGRQDLQPAMTRTRAAIVQAMNAISKELVWKVHFESAQIEERAAASSRRELAKLSATNDELRYLIASTKKRDDEAYLDDGLENARKACARSVMACPTNLRWKVWLAGARMELGAPENVKLLYKDPSIGYRARERSLIVARNLFARAFQDVPEKSKCYVLLDCARLEEFAFLHNPSTARHILSEACVTARSEWKTFLEVVMLEMRACNFELASKKAVDALKIHSGTGRLWASLVQLRQFREAWSDDLLDTADTFNETAGLPSLEKTAPFVKPKKEFASWDDHDNTDSRTTWDFSWAQTVTLRMALNEVPKSGEVWCEGARIHLNPIARTFDIVKAQRFIDFAIQFTPQYGDSFMEQLRICLIVEHVLPRACALIAEGEWSRVQLKEKMKAFFLQRLQAYESVQGTDPILKPKEGWNKESALLAVVRCGIEANMLGSSVVLLTNEDLRRSLASNRGSSRSTNQHCLEPFTVQTLENYSFPRLDLRCSNADPNYGLMWFQCRGAPSDTAIQILRRAQRSMANELHILAPLYLQASYRRMMVEQVLIAAIEEHPDSTTLSNILNSYLWEDVVESGLRHAVPVEPWSLHLRPCVHDFVTGLVGLNRLGATIHHQNDEHRRKVLFGSDQIIP